MHLGTRGGKRPGAGIRAGKADHLVARADEFLNNGRPDKPGRTGDEDTHRLFPRVVSRPHSRPVMFKVGG